MAIPSNVEVVNSQTHLYMNFYRKFAMINVPLVPMYVCVCVCLCMYVCVYVLFLCISLSINPRNWFTSQYTRTLTSQTGFVSVFGHNIQEFLFVVEELFPIICYQ